MNIKKKILVGIAVLTIVVITVLNVNLNSDPNNLSSVSLVNIEALAAELPEVVISCSTTYHDCYSISSSFSGKCWKPVSKTIGNCCQYTDYTSDYCCSIFC